ncbi:MAG: hypothetical protein N3B18_00490 [Desulfobacterota bacterium]|nr:hypothetical protein [Thermodesulfobacteriota bacterium]
MAAVITLARATTIFLLFFFFSSQPATALTFEPISEHGFDPVDTQQDFNDYPWSMVFFQPDNSTTGHIYVGTGNSMMNLIMSRLGITLSISPLKRPPEIRRYRPERGTKTWEKVFDYRDIEPEPEWQTSGIRSLAVYRSLTDGTQHLYAGTFGTKPSLWRSPSGDPGSWELVWRGEIEGSIRALQEHRGFLYIGVTHEFLDQVIPGELYVFDGETTVCINNDGFGNANNTGVYSLVSFNGWLYAGTSNRTEGYEVWKLAGPDHGTPPVKIISGGGPFRGNQAAATMKVFNNKLYVGCLIFAGINTAGGPIVRGADMIRIAPDDTWETVVGPDAVGGVDSGFGKRTNAYLWSMEVFNGELYCGTWDAASFIPVTRKYLPDIRRSLLWFLLGVKAARPTPYDLLTKNGGELFRSADGVHWSTVFKDGLGNPDNFGIRQLLAHDGALYIGFANIDEGLEIWRAAP